MSEGFLDRRKDQVMEDARHNENTKRKLGKKPKIPTPLKSRKVLVVLLVLVLVGVAAFAVSNNKSDSSGGEYHDTDMKGTASFELDVDLKRNCKDQKDCDPNKPTYDFKVFVFLKDGTQVRVVRGDNEGKFKASLPEGDYVLITAKGFEGKEGLPQETISLKNGKELRLHVDYGTEQAAASK